MPRTKASTLTGTAEVLPLHADRPSHELLPGFRFPHRIANGAEDGESVFADGSRVAERMRQRDSAAFDLP